MSKLPPSWKEVLLGEIASTTSGIGFPKHYQGESNGDLGFYKVGDISKAVLEYKGQLSNPQHKVSFEIAKKLKGTPITAGATVFAKIGEAIKLNRRAIVTNECLIDNNVMAVKAELDELDQYLYLYLRTQDFTELSRATTVPSLRKGDIETLVVPLPPLNESKRIADKLDRVLARVDACRDRLDRIPAILKRFRQSVIAAAVSGQLTEEWRYSNPGIGSGEEQIKSDHAAKALMLKTDSALAKKKSSANADVDYEYIFDIPETWAFTSWGKLTEWITYGFTRPMPSATSGMKLVTAKDVQYFSLQISEAGHTTTEAFELLSDKDRPCKGDLLITKDGTIGRAALVTTDEPFCINQSVAVCWLRSTSMNKQYLELVANAEFTQRFVFDKAKGMAIQHLSITDFAQAPIPVPPPVEQNEIVRRVESLFAYADRLEARYHTARAQVEKLTPALLAKAFRGELVPQDPNDEPASELLARIQASRATEIPKKNRKPTSGKSIRAPKETTSMTKSRQDDDVKNQAYLAGHLKLLGGSAAVELLFKAAELPVADFYKQLAWEVEQGLVIDKTTVLEAASAA